MSSYASDPAAYEALLNDIAAGAQLHYDTAGSEDLDLDLLRGDRSYAQGLGKLAELGDLAATQVLGDAISAMAAARAAGDADGAQMVWQRAVETVREQGS